MDSLWNDIDLQVPIMLRETGIPRKIHQVFFPISNLPQKLVDCADRLRQQNPNWEYQLHDEFIIESFIRKYYGDFVFNIFDKINPQYGAARADLYRYLLMYKTGGAYFDIKSGLIRPLDEIISDDDSFIVSEWYRTQENGRMDFGRDARLSYIKGGALQQWHIICEPGHPFMRAVILRVLYNILTYNPWRDGTGGTGTFAVTGPVAYTLAISPIIDTEPHRMTNDHAAGFVYRQFEESHRELFSGHYLDRTDPVVLSDSIKGRLSGLAYSCARIIKRALVRK